MIKGEMHIQQKIKPINVLMITYLIEEISNHWPFLHEHRKL